MPRQGQTTSTLELRVGEISRVILAEPNPVLRHLSFQPGVEHHTTVGFPASEFL